MAYRITQSEDTQSGKLILLLEGSFDAEGGQKIEQICEDAMKKFGKNIMIDVSGVTFLDEASSAVICRLKNQEGLSLIGCHLFTKKVIEQSESR
jgi:anti-anti-sigma regulatory factor